MASRQYSFSLHTAASLVVGINSIIMRLFITILIYIVLTGCSHQEVGKYDLVIANVNLIDGTGAQMQKNVNIYIKDKIIEKIDTGNSGFGKIIIDGTDKYLIPGLFDCHTHTVDYKTDFPGFVHYGITSILVTGGSKCTDDYFTEMRAMGEQDSIPSPRVFHTSQHFTMKGKHPVKTYASDNWVDGETVFYLKDTLQIEAIVKQVSKQPIVGIKLTVEDGPLPPFVERMPQEFVNKVVKEAKKYGLNVFVHASDNVELKMAQQAGVQNYLHYVMIDLDWERDTSIITGLIENNATIVTTLMLKKSWLYPLHPDWIQQLDEANIYSKEEIEYLENPARRGKSLGILKGRKFMIDEEIPSLLSMITHQIDDLKALQKDGINVALGSDTGNDFILPGISLHEEMQIMELGGFEPLEIIKMATYNAAMMLNRLDSLGTVEEGKYADMVLLDRNPLDSIGNTLFINRVIKNGGIQKRMN